MSEDNSHSHQINQSSMTGDNTSSHIHSGASVLSNDGQSFAPGGAGMAQALSGKILGSLAQKLENPLGDANIGSMFDSINQNAALNNNVLSACDGVHAPVGGLNMAGQMGSLNGVAPVELKNFQGSINMGLEGNTGLLSQQKGGQSH